MENKPLLSSEHQASEHHKSSGSRVKKPVIIFFCFILEILHLLLIWSVYDGIQRIRSPRGPELDGRKFSQQEQDAHA